MRNDWLRQHFVKLMILVKVRCFHFIGYLGIVLAFLCYLISYLLLEKLLVKLVLRTLEAFLLLAELFGHLQVVLTNINPLLQSLYL